MASQKFEFSDVTASNRCNSETNLTMNSQGKRGRGIYISAVVGFVLILLAVILAVLVGLVVHFAGGNKDVVCKCETLSDHGNQADQLEDLCVELASNGNTDVCTSCPAPSEDPTPTTKTVTSKKVTDVRLPSHVSPIHYDVEIQTFMHHADPKDFTFSGKMKLKLKCIEDSDNVTLHVNVLNIDKDSISFESEHPNTADPELEKFETDKERQFFIIKLSKNMQAGKIYWVEMSYTSPLRDDLHGLYYSSYKRGGRNVYLATTQLQSTDARKTFPCLDEPALKATFDITLVRPSNMKSISNMPIIENSTTFVDGPSGIHYVKDVYQTTPIMSTYLLAFIVCDFDYLQAVTQNGVVYQAWARPEAKESAQYSLDIGVEILTYFESYFEIKFPLPKQAMIAIPDFAAGAMENWGLITYRETAMLYQEGVSNIFNKERVAIVVSHELAHQWFGDLVTPQWWDDLWLNEGFASFVEFLGVDHVHPEWNLFDDFVVSQLQYAFDFDGLISSHPVYVPVAHPDEINEIFDSISYSKGAAIIRMMRHFLGEETFRKGVVRYLNRTSYSSAFHDDLWDALTEQAVADGLDIDVEEVMDTWTLQMNFPVVTLTRDFNDKAVIRARQSRYLVDPEAVDPGKFESPFGYKWNIPLTFTSSKTKDFQQTSDHVIWMKTTEQTKDIEMDVNDLPDTSDGDGWILGNIQQYGYYRVNYQTGNWHNIAKQLKTNHEVFPIPNRAQIINDAWNLAKPGTIGLDIPLKIIEYLSDEKSHVPWNAASTELRYVDHMIALDSTYGDFQKFMRSILRRPFSEISLTTSETNRKKIRYQVVIAGLACKYGISECVDATVSMYKQWMDSPSDNQINVNLKLTVYCTAIKHGGYDEWNFALQKYLETDIPSERALLLSAMTCSREPWILNNYLSILLAKDSPIRKQDTLRSLRYVAGNINGRSLAWNFFRHNYDTLKEQYGQSLFAWTSLVEGVPALFNTEFELRELTEFIEEKKDNLGSGARAFEQAKEKISSNIKWLKKNKPVIRQWLDTLSL